MTDKKIKKRRWGMLFGTKDYCKSFLTENRVVKEGSASKSQNRCSRLKDLVPRGFGNLMSHSKNKIRKLPASLSLRIGTKD